jgi:DNA-binding IclR family transcriptional regulator
MRPARSQPKQVAVLGKTLDILEVIKTRSAGIALAEVARSVGMPKPTVYRILATLEIRGYLDRSVDGAYRVSSKLFSLQSATATQQDLLRVAPPIMEKMALECRETVNLGTIDGGEVLVIATCESPQSVRMASKVGNRRCIHTTGLGKILLASMDDQEIRRLVQLKGLPGLTPYSITTESALTIEIQKIRRQGYALDNQENELEGRCVALRIPGAIGLPAALSISGPVFRMDLRRLKALVPILQKGCEEFAKTLRK